MEEELFEYDPENHIGRVNGEIIPSVTQIVDILFPMDEKISPTVLKNKARKGTEAHKDIEHYNNGFIEHCETDFGHQYEILAKAYELEPVVNEVQVLIRDRKGHIICYGTFDAIITVLENNMLMNKEEEALVDYKTVANLIKDKVDLQLNIYRLGWYQRTNVDIKRLFAIHLQKDSGRIVPLETGDLNEILDKVEYLCTEWHKTA